MRLTSSFTLLRHAPYPPAMASPSRQRWRMGGWSGCVCVWGGGGGGKEGGWGKEAEMTLCRGQREMMSCRRDVCAWCFWQLCSHSIMPSRAAAVSLSSEGRSADLATSGAESWLTSRRNSTRRTAHFDQQEPHVLAQGPAGTAHWGLKLRCEANMLELRISNDTSTSVGADEQRAENEAK